ncbi:MAG: glycosyltransferase family 4 protein [Acidobacteriales bacterium]|nr:glycosyltransferase family 4 protein [Terriglobales bacterium]
MAGYDGEALSLELQAVRHMATHRACMYHFLYADDSYNLLGYLNGWRAHRLVGTYHHPPFKLATYITAKEILKQLSGVIVVGSNQRSFFLRHLPPERIACIPHAVDTSYFIPPADFEERESRLCLFVGHHLRDFRTLKMIIDDARVSAPHLKFAVVLHEEGASHFAHVEGHFTAYVGISDSDLLGLYQRATVMIQPLVDTTANTAVLEAMSSGLPLVITDIGAVHDYADERSARFVPPFRPQQMLEQVLDLISDSNSRRRMSAAARSRALEFDFCPVSQRIREFYLSLRNIT